MTSAADAATYARRLVPQAVAAFTVVPAAERGPALAAIDRFLGAPSPTTFLAATRILRESERAAALARTGGATITRLLHEGAARLREVPGFPDDLVAELTRDLPRDPRAGRRLAALGELLGSYAELLGRVAADTAEMRARWKTGKRRPPPPPTKKKRKR